MYEEYLVSLERLWRESHLNNRPAFGNLYVNLKSCYTFVCDSDPVDIPYNVSYSIWNMCDQLKSELGAEKQVLCQEICKLQDIVDVYDLPTLELLLKRLCDIFVTVSEFGKDVCACTVCRDTR